MPKHSILFFVWFVVHFSISTFLFISRTPHIRWYAGESFYFVCLSRCLQCFISMQSHFLCTFTIPLICWFHIFIGMVPTSIQNDSIAWEIIQMTVFSSFAIRFICSFKIYMQTIHGLTFDFASLCIHQPWILFPFMTIFYRSMRFLRIF